MQKQIKMILKSWTETREKTTDFIIFAGEAV